MKFTLSDLKREIEGPQNISEVDSNELKEQIRVTTAGLQSKAITERNPVIFKSMVKYLAETKLKCRKKGLLYFGNPGTGKTFAAKVIAAFRDLHFYTCEELESKYEKSPDAFWEIIKERKDIVIDDLGTEKTRSDYGAKFELMGKALSERHKLFEQYGVKTIITSNLSGPKNEEGKSIEDRYTTRIYSRLHQMCECVNAAGKDLRRFKG
tara:strand:- start:1270 stop:1896 length:627 start_codon:yes stop_codon:yes gene_type:complete